MAEIKAEVSGYFLTEDADGLFKVVVAYSEFMRRRGEMDWRPLWTRYKTSTGLELERIDDGTFVERDCLESRLTVTRRLERGCNGNGTPTAT